MLIYIVLIVLTSIYLMKRRKEYNSFWKYIYAIPGPKCYPVIGTVASYLKSPAAAGHATALGYQSIIDYVRQRGRKGALPIQCMQFMPVTQSSYVTSRRWGLFPHSQEYLYEHDRKRSKEFYPIYKIWSFNLVMVYLISPGDIELVLTNPKHITKGLLYDLLHIWLGTGLLTSTDAKWQHRRKILTPAFHFSILQKFIDIFNKETENLVKVLKESSSKPYIDVVKPITEFTLNSIGETSLGVTLNDEPNVKEYKSAVHTFGKLFTDQLVQPWLRINFVYYFSATAQKLEETVKTLHDFSTNIIRKRQQNYKSQGGSYSQKKRMAMLDLLLKAKLEEGVDIDDEGIREEVDTFMFEGHDTTSLAICYCLLVFAHHPETQNEILQEIKTILSGSKKYPDFQDLGEMKYMERCIKEVLRLYPSVPVISRVLGEEIQSKSGYILPKGTTVNIVIRDLHHSSQVWENPEKFDPNRFLPENISGRHPFAYLPFSAGQRNCIGQRFAILEIKAVLCGILQNFVIKPVDSMEDIKNKVDLVLRPTGQIRVKFVPRDI